LLRIGAIYRKFHPNDSPVLLGSLHRHLNGEAVQL
jgi:hypothetical protein